MNRIGLMICMSTIIFAAKVNAETLRCKGDLVQIGDSKASVMLKCGEPMLKDSFCKPTRLSTVNNINVDGCETIDAWTYNPGSGQFLTTLKFSQGEVVSIEYGDRVP